MSVTPEQIYAVAEILVSNSVSEASLRSSASRAYYAALHATDRTIPESYAGKSFVPESTHEKVIEKARSMSRQQVQGRMEAAELFGILPKAKKLRVRADYYLDESFDSKMHQTAMAYAKKILGLAEELNKKVESPGSQ